MKVKKFIFYSIVLTIVILITISILSPLIYERYLKDYIEDRTGISVSNCSKVNENENHGTFFKKGTTAIEYDCSATDISIFSANLEEVPLSSDLQIMLYGGVKDGINYEMNAALEYDIPVVENGYYYFYDEYSDSSSDEFLLSRDSFHFVFIAFDSSNKHLYYLEYEK